MARPKNSENMLPRSVRIPETVWIKAKRRAESEGRSISNVMADLVEGYSRGVYELPRTQIIKKYPTE